MTGHIITLTPTQWQELQNNESIVIGGITYDYNEENLYMVVETPYRVGDIVISTKNESPARVYGGSWEQLPEGYALWTTTSEIVDEENDRTIEAGLPNITGTFRGGYKGSNPIQSGAFIADSSGTASKTGSANTGENQNTLYTFDASQANAIYGASNTVQPPAYKVYAWERVA